jgi:hypothetical protein
MYKLGITNKIIKSEDKNFFELIDVDLMHLFEPMLLIQVAEVWASFILLLLLF